ncbi:MAG: molybdenum cofactor biosynthesis protein MoaE [Gemmatimonadota bacterium]|nr:MAG: molybdenum cofactor biosynthesis protein MoaE [Gemmatimonadota bacterium]
MMSRARITTEPIEPQALLAGVGDPSRGAVILFLGVVRNHNDGHGVEGIRYDAYDEMARGTLEEILVEAEERYGVGHLAAVHRVGELGIGEVSVAIAVSSAHRAEAFDASRYVIEEIKVRLPVWKKERFEDGTSEWVAGKQPEVSAEGGA